VSNEQTNPPTDLANSARQYDPRALRIYDFGTLAVLGGLTVLMLATWSDIGGRSVSEAIRASVQVMASAWLLLGLGLLLAVRCGTVDLSIWAVMWLAAVTAGRLVELDWSVNHAVAAAVACGLCAGLAVGLAGMWHGVAGAVGSLAVGAIAVWLSQWITGGETIEAEVLSEQIKQWLGWVESEGRRSGALPARLEIPALRMLMVAMVYSAVMLGLLLLNIVRRGFDRDHPAGSLSGPWQRRGVRLLGHVLAGGLAGLAGVGWLLEHGRVEAPHRIVGDLRVPLAVGLCGGWLLKGKGRTLLAGALLPAALLCVTRWRQQVWPLPVAGYELQLLVLGAMLVVILLALATLAWPGGGRRIGVWLALALASAGPVLPALAGQFDAEPTRRWLHRIAVAMSVLGLAVLGGVWLRARLRRR
jgi:ribose/xylose/arabinose/galactoside ABC-type transport system permease subunit